MRWAYGFLWFLEHKRVAAENCANDDLELHVREVLAHTPPIIAPVSSRARPEVESVD